MKSKSNAIVILGASGHLARNKLLPALDLLWKHGKLGSSDIIIGVGRSAIEEQDFRQRFSVSPDLSARLFYHQGITRLGEFIRSKGAFERVILFLAQPPSTYFDTIRQLAQESFGGETSIVIEKPFGHDYASARRLNEELGKFFKESQIYRIDHYLAKEAVQNILVFRFANSIFYPIWNSRYIRSIQINALETDRVGSRASYFDSAGIIRDMVQNHILQLLCLLTMEAPVSLNPLDIRAQKISILRTIEFIQCHRYQYEGYRQEPGVSPDSLTETFVEIKLVINNFRWSGMPIFIRTGKALHRKGIEIGIDIKPIPRILYNESGRLKPNRIIFKIQPAEGIIVDMSTKVPGTDSEISSTKLAFCYRDAFEQQVPEAYQRALLDILRCDHTLFVGGEETEIAWEKIEPILDKGELDYYQPGSIPPSKFAVEWIDFDSYGSCCVR